MRKLLISFLSILSISFFSTVLFAKDSMVVSYKDDVSTLDPAIGYDWQNWSMIKSLFDGLMDYEPGTTNLTPDLAESYSVSDDGMTYTFNLRQGVKFHNGRELTSDDIKYSIERSVNPETQSPGAGFFWSIDGFDSMSSGSANNLSGISTPDKHTVVIKLSQPDATFLHVVAINFSFAVPKEEIEKYGQDFATHPVGTGAYKLKEWVLGQRVVFEKNSEYFKAGVPKLDEIEFQVGLEPNVALLKLQKGEVDILGDGIPPAKYLDVVNDPNNKDLIVIGDQLHTGYLTINVNIAPLDNVKVRQAINMAINKDRIIQIINGRASPANQPLPPAMPGYDNNYKGYAYDPDGAKKLLAEAGLSDGFSTEIWNMNTDPNPRITQSIQKDLSSIGINAEIKSLAQSTVIAAGGEKDQAPLLWSGGMAWIADFPDPSNFYGPILGCGGAVPGGWNWAWYCNEELDAKSKIADGMFQAEKSAERLELWRSIYIDIMEEAPWAPVFNELRVTMHSDKISAEDNALFVDPTHIPVHYDYISVK